MFKGLKKKFGVKDKPFTSSPPVTPPSGHQSLINSLNNQTNNLSVSSSSPTSQSNNAASPDLSINSNNADDKPKKRISQHVNKSLTPSPNTQPTNQSPSHSILHSPTPTPDATLDPLDESRAELLKPLPSLADNITSNQTANIIIDSSKDPLLANLTPKQTLLIHKLRLCCVQFEWTRDETTTTPTVSPPASLKQSPLQSPVQTLDARLKEAKRSHLLDLLEFIGRSPLLYSEPALSEFMTMVTTNLFRALPPAQALPASEEDEPVCEARWPHLQVVYELFLHFIVSAEVDVRALKKHVHAGFVLKLLELFASEDHRERDYLKTLLHRIYAKFMSLRAFIRKAINHVFYNVIYDDERHAGVAELLEILGSIINGFALPLKNEHKLFLKRVLVPMHKVRTLAQFHQQLSYCVCQFVDKDPELSLVVLQGLFKYWPIANSAKEVLYLHELEQVLELTHAEEFAQLSKPIAARLALAIHSPHFQVAERALFLWHNEYVGHFMAQHRQTILPIIFPALEAAANPCPSSLDTADQTAEDALHGHWNPTVNSLTLNVLKIFVDLDPTLVQECREQYRLQQQQERRTATEREVAWRALNVRIEQQKHDGEAEAQLIEQSEGVPNGDAANVETLTVKTSESVES